MKRLLFALAAGLTLLAAGRGQAARVEADPNKEYAITPEVGPFVICVKGYIGPNAHTLANQLTLHMRQCGWPAYVFDYSAEERRKAKEMLDERYRMAPEIARHKKIEVKDQWGVLVGGYPDLDSARKDVDRVKALPWKDLPKTQLDILNTGTAELQAVSPYAYAFATRNPLMTQPKPDPAAADPAWKELNEGRPYNLLKCGKPWTLAVKQFQGMNVIQPRSMSSKFLQAIGFGDKQGDLLAASAKQAEEVARVLCQMNYKAYVLHTRGASIVTVGAYDRPDHPDLLRAQKELANLKLVDEKVVHDPKWVELYQFFAQPMPMKVPEL
jgi:hypothetical protein